MLTKIKQNEDQLTVMDNYVGVGLEASNKFAKEYLYPSQIPYIFCGGKMGGLTYTNANILVPKKNLVNFLELFGKYAKGNNLSPIFELNSIDWNLFTEKSNSPTTYLLINDKSD